MTWHNFRSIVAFNVSVNLANPSVIFSPVAFNFKRQELGLIHLHVFCRLQTSMGNKTSWRIDELKDHLPELVAYNPGCPAPPGYMYQRFKQARRAVAEQARAASRPRLTCPPVVVIRGNSWPVSSLVRSSSTLLSWWLLGLTKGFYAKKKWWKIVRALKNVSKSCKNASKFIKFMQIVAI